MWAWLILFLSHLMINIKLSRSGCQISWSFYPLKQWLNCIHCLSGLLIWQNPCAHYQRYKSSQLVSFLPDPLLHYLQPTIRASYASLKTSISDISHSNCRRCKSGQALPQPHQTHQCPLSTLHSYARYSFDVMLMRALSWLLLLGQPHRPNSRARLLIVCRSWDR
jgi:hypothetical protein